MNATECNVMIEVESENFHFIESLKSKISSLKRGDGFWYCNTVAEAVNVCKSIMSAGISVMAIPCYVRSGNHGGYPWSAFSGEDSSDGESAIAELTSNGIPCSRKI